MNSISRFILLSTVLFLNTTAAWGQTTPAATPANTDNSEGAAIISDCRRDFPRGGVDYSKCLGERRQALRGGVSEDARECRTATAKVAEALAKARTACMSSGSETGTPARQAADVSKEFQSCLDRAKECAQMSEEERSPDVLSSTFSSLAGSFGFPINTQQPQQQDGNNRGQCMNRKDHREQVRDTNRDLERAEESVQRLKKDIVAAAKDAAEEQDRLNKSIQDLMKSAREEDVQANNDARERSEKAQATAVQTQDQIRKLNQEILQAQGTLADAIAKRTSSLAKLSNAMVQKNCMEELEKLQLSQRAFRNGQAGAVIANRRERDRRNKMTYDMCIQEMITLREGARESTQRNIEAIQASIADREAQIRGLQEALALHNSNQQQQQQELQTSRSQAQQERQSALQNLQNQLQTSNTRLQQTTQNINQQL